MLPQYLFRRQCLISLLFVVSLVSLLTVTTKYFTVFHNISNRVYERGREFISLQHDVNGRKEGEGRKNVDMFPGRNVIRRVEGVMDSEGCKMKTLDPFNKEMMKYMHDFGDHKCPRRESGDVKVDVQGNNLTIEGTDIDFVKLRSISHHVKTGFVFHEFVYLEKQVHSNSLVKNRTGAIRNVASKRCIVPRYNHKKPPAEIEVMFSTECSNDDVKFTFTMSGLIRHVQTSKCLGPEGGSLNPSDNIQLVLSDHCQARFQVVNKGALQLVDAPTFCVHPLWGGNIPSEGQNLCLYSSCDAEERLYYTWFRTISATKRKTSKQYHLTSDMTHLQIQFLDEKIINKFMITVVPRPLPTHPHPLASQPPTPQLPRPQSPNIIVIVIEEASAAHFKRKLQFVNVAMSKMGFKEYRMFSGASPSALTNFISIVNGHPNSEVGSIGDSLFNVANNSNYVTLFSADDPMLLTGFDEVLDAHHNSRPFFAALKKQNLHSQSYCVNDEAIYNISFKYLTSFIQTYPSKPKLAIMLLSEIIRNNFNHLGYIDKHLMELLDFLKTLNNTIAVVATLKGGETGKLAQLEQGVNEIKRPLLATYTSSDIGEKIKFEETRLGVLNTPYDVYVTLRDLIQGTSSEHERGLSLLAGTLRERNCLQASVYPLMCPCE